MSEPGRALPSRPSPLQHQHRTRRLSRAVHRVGCLLCWNLAAAMTTAGTDLLLNPRTHWWNRIWPLPWYLTCACALAWAALRAREKTTRQQPDDNPSPGEFQQAA
ncbi:hypothetical protein [Streptomyces sp. enrichment culture]|uniref:hypothetical protein n=1 Tax=Streptomyces sp. enrichment culture TaxID=1795815 RepID=UPI003F542704